MPLSNPSPNGALVTGDPRLKADPPHRSDERDQKKAKSDGDCTLTPSSVNPSPFKDKLASNQRQESSIELDELEEIKLDYDDFVIDREGSTPSI